MEDIKKKPYIDERYCLGIDCAWCLDTECVLSKLPYNKEEKQNDNMVQG